MIMILLFTHTFYIFIFTFYSILFYVNCLYVHFFTRWLWAHQKATPKQIDASPSLQNPDNGFS